MVSSKSGGTVETDSHRRAYWQAFLDAGLTEAEAGRHFVIVTDPGSPLEATARGDGRRGAPGRPRRGRPLLGADRVRSGTHGAGRGRRGRAAGPGRGHPAALARRRATTRRWRSAPRSARPPRTAGDKIALVDDGTGITGLGDWAEQLIAESTGKEGRASSRSWSRPRPRPAPAATDVLTVTVGGALPPGTVPGGGREPDVAVNGPLGAQFLVWEYADRGGRAGARHQPVRPAQRDRVQGQHQADPGRRPARRGSRPFVEGAIEVYGDALAPSPSEALRDLVNGVDTAGYLAVMAYLDRFADADTAILRGAGPGGSGAPGHLRLGTPLPALHRTVPQGRPAGRLVPADHRRGRRGPAGTGQAVQLRRAAGGTGGR